MPKFIGFQIIALIIFFITFVTSLVMGKLYFVLMGSMAAFALIIWSFSIRKKELENKK